MRNLKIDVLKMGYSPLKVENNRGVTNDVMFAYLHETINILLSFWSIYFLFLFYFNLNTQRCVY